jgi:uncharacterized membrane protein
MGLRTGGHCLCWNCAYVRGQQPRLAGVLGQAAIWAASVSPAPVLLHDALIPGPTNFLQVAFVASFVSKLSDTVSSEIGKVR